MSVRSVQPTDLLQYVLVSDAQLSPDANTILFARKHINGKKQYVTQLWTTDAAGRVQQLTRSEASCSHGRWLPDGSGILFISQRTKPASQIYRLPVSGGEAYAVTEFPEGSLAEFKISPDGEHVAVLFRETHPDWTDAAKKAREAAEASTLPIEIDDIWYRLDGDGYFAGQRYALIVLKLEGESLATEVMRYAAAPDGNYSFSWHPSGDSLIVAHTANAFPMREKPNDQLYRVSLSGEATMLPGLPKGEKSAPSVSPDGQWVAYAGDVDEDDPWGTRNTKAYLVSIHGGEPRDLTGHQDFDLSVATLSDAGEPSYSAKLMWAADGSGLYTQVGTFGQSQIGFVSVNGGVTLLTEGHHTINWAPSPKTDRSPER